jgi:hypothetical protein
MELKLNLPPIFLMNMLLLLQELHPSGRCFLTGHRNGRMRLWSLPITPSLQQQQQQQQKEEGGEEATRGEQQQQQQQPSPVDHEWRWMLPEGEGFPPGVTLNPPAPLMETIDSMSFLAGAWNGSEWE